MASLFSILALLAALFNAREVLVLGLAGSRLNTTIPNEQTSRVEEQRLSEIQGPLESQLVTEPESVVLASSFDNNLPRGGRDAYLDTLHPLPFDGTENATSSNNSSSSSNSQPGAKEIASGFRLESSTQPCADEIVHGESIVTSTIEPTQPIQWDYTWPAPEIGGAVPCPSLTSSSSIQLEPPALLETRSSTDGPPGQANANSSTETAQDSFENSPSSLPLGAFADLFREKENENNNHQGHTGGRQRGHYDNSAGHDEKKWFESLSRERDAILWLGASVSILSQTKKRRLSSVSDSKEDSKPRNKKPFQNPRAIIAEPQTRPISQEQLVAEVKGIYAGLVMVESKCIEVKMELSKGDTPMKLNNEQYQALIALHRTLIYEHHDFLLASQHPSASPALRRLASKYAMPARMWRHGIHSFLELLRHSLPGSVEHLLRFIYLAYLLVALLYETVPAFEDTWMECLGDLARFRMAIEDDDIRDREIWTMVSRYWYSKSSERSPTTGRLYHHLAILARPNVLQQLFYFTKSLCTPIPFLPSRESILTLFDPVLCGNSASRSRLAATDLAFLRTHGALFTNEQSGKLETFREEFISHLDHNIASMKVRWLEHGYYLAIANCNSILGYGNGDNLVLQIIQGKTPERGGDELGPGDGDDSSLAWKMFKQARILVTQTDMVVFTRYEDPHVLSYAHVRLAFMLHVSKSPAAMDLLKCSFPWGLVATFLNSLLAASNLSTPARPVVEETFFMDGNQTRPLPEDYAMRSLIWTDDYLPDAWFTKHKLEPDEYYAETSSMTDARKQRILHLGHQLSQLGSWISCDSETNLFTVPPDLAEYHPSCEPSETETPAFATQRLTRKSGSESPTGNESKSLAVLYPDNNGTSLPRAETSPELAGTSNAQNFVDPSVLALKSPAASEALLMHGIPLTNFILSDKSARLPAANWADASTEALTSRGTEAQAQASITISYSPSQPLSNEIVTHPMRSQDSTPRGDRTGHQCPHCNRSYSRACDLRKHLPFHTKPYPCPVPGCPEGFATSKDLERHKHGPHQDLFGKTRFVCERCREVGCDKEYGRKDHLMRHMKTDHGII